MNYLKAEEILLVHSLVIDETGGIHGVRDTNVILSLEKLPQQTAFGEELYPTVFFKAAVYTRTIIMNHPFIDGNKRTGMTSAVVFLENNDVNFFAQEGEIEKIVLKIINERLSLEELADWFEHHSKK